MRHAVGVLIFALGLGVLSASVQDLGTIARQERARQEATECPARVLTNEDLARRRILRSEERATCEEARVRLPNLPQAETAAPEVDIPLWRGETATTTLMALPVPPPPGAPLGDVARYYRALRQARELASGEQTPAPDVPLHLSRSRTVTAFSEPPALPRPAMSLDHQVRYFGVLRDLYESAPDVPVEIRGIDAAPTRAAVLPRAPRPSLQPGELVKRYGVLRDEKLAEAAEPPAVPVRREVRGSAMVSFDGVPVPPPPDAPLGDVARYYRELEEARESQRRLQERVSELEAVASRAVERSRAGVPPLREQKPSVVAVESYTVVVQSGDSLWRLAEKHYGDGAAWPRLAAMNPEITNPNLIYAGQVLRLRREEFVTLARERRVEAGDTLWGVAQAEYGSGSAWQCIAQANPQIHNADLIYPGQVVALPESCGSAL